MKKVFVPARLAGVMFAVFTIAAAAMAQTPDTDWYTANPGATEFTISTADELAGLAEIVNGDWGGVPERDDFSGKTVTLKDDIDLSVYDNWMPIGHYNINELYDINLQTPRTSFTGTFDGGGHVISNLTISRPDLLKGIQLLGLFGGVRGGEVKNLGLDNVDISGGFEYIGAVAGAVDNNSNITNCYSTGSVSGVNIIGGLVGYLEGSITNSYSAAMVSGSNVYVGGVAGKISKNSLMANCYSIGAVSGNGGVGGLVGFVDPFLMEGIGTITNCAALNPSVKATGSNFAGRIGAVGVIGYPFSNNVAYTEMIDNNGNTAWANKGNIVWVSNSAGAVDGEDIATNEIRADGTLGGRFTDAGGWTTEDGKLPGLGAAVELPAHLTVMIYNVAVVPAETRVNRGKTRQFTAIVVGASENKAVTWAVSGNSSSSTTVSAAGLLSIAADETAATLTVTATSTANTEMSAAAMVTVTQLVDIDWYIDAITANPDTAKFTISTAEELAMLAKIVNGTWGGEPHSDDFSGKTITLAADIDLSLYDNWVPIGGVHHNFFPAIPTVFSGVFNGDGHVISNLVINRPDMDYQGLFGAIGNGGRVESLGLDNVNIIGGGAVGAVAGMVSNGGVANCYSTGVISGSGAGHGFVGTGYGVGGVVGSIFGREVSNGSYVANSYSTATVSGNWYVGGVTGMIAYNSAVINCYSTGAVSGNRGVGGVVGGFRVVTADFVETSNVTNCAALNPEVKGDEYVGRVVGNNDGGTLSNNIAYAGMINNDGNTDWVNKGADNWDGEDIIAVVINADGTIGGRFIAENGWTIEDGWLLDLNGETVTMPRLMENFVVAVASPDRVIPQSNNNDDVAIVVPANTLTAQLTAGPNPVGKSSGKVNFYRQGKRVDDGTLTIYDASGNVINKIRISDNAVPANNTRRQVGAWDLTDSKGRVVPTGTYLVKGVVVVSGKKEKVSILIGVR